MVSNLSESDILSGKYFNTKKWYDKLNDRLIKIKTNVKGNRDYCPDASDPNTDPDEISKIGIASEYCMFLLCRSRNLINNNQLKDLCNQKGSNTGRDLPTTITNFKYNIEVKSDDQKCIYDYRTGMLFYRFKGDPPSGMSKTKYNDNLDYELTESDWKSRIPENSISILLQCEHSKLKYWDYKFKFVGWCHNSRFFGKNFNNCRICGNVIDKGGTKGNYPVHAIHHSKLNQDIEEFFLTIK